MEENKRISDLFDRARNEAPKISVEKTTKHFLAASAAGGAGILAKWVATSFKFKAIVMIGTLSTLTISGILIVTQLTSSAQSAEVKSDEISESSGETIEFSSENGIQKMTIYDENNTILDVIVDSSIRKEKTNQTIELAIKQPGVLPRTKTVQTSNSTITWKESTLTTEDASDSLTKRKFTITQNTSSEELKRIVKQASDAGVDFDYNMRVRKNIIKKINMSMIIKNGSGMSEWQAKVSGSKTFSFEFGWNEDSSGKAVSIINSCEAVARTERAERPERPEAPERPERSERAEAPERPERPERPETPERN